MMAAMLGLTMAMNAASPMIQISPKIMPFRGGAEAAVSLQFDDSMLSQVQNCLPLLEKYKFPATFFINPGRNDYESMRPVWEGQVEKQGHELANHTWTHNGAIDKDHAEEEIHRLSVHLRELRGGKPRIVPFGIPGGVPWNVTPAELEGILRKDNLFLATDREFFEDKNTWDPCAPAKRALAGHSWARMGFHGVGGQWLSTSVANLSKVLDYLTENKEKIWVATTGDVYKYIQERDSIMPITANLTRSGITFDLQTDPSKNPFGPESQGLFDEPLTIQCEVPDTWGVVNVRQGKAVSTGKIIKTGGQLYAVFEAIPNAGKVMISRNKL